MEVSITDSDYAVLRRASGLFTRDEIKRYDKCSRFGFLDPWNTPLQLREYLFFTKPDLHLFNSSSGSEINYQIKNIPFFQEAFSNYKDLYKSFVISLSGNKTPFINLWHNQVNSNLELPAIVSEVVEGPTTVNDSQIKYQSATMESDQNFEFSLEFKDTQSLEVYESFKLWNEYEKNKNKISPPDYTKYTLNKILHDQICVYKFIIADDGETLVHYSKLYGVFPKGVPRDSFGNLDSSGGLSYTVSFNATFVEDFNPMIISDFNNLVSPFISGKSDIPIYDMENCCINGTWCNMPYFVFEPKPEFGTIGKYKMKWR